MALSVNPSFRVTPWPSLDKPEKVCEAFTYRSSVKFDELALVGWIGYYNTFMVNILGKADVGLCSICGNPRHDPHLYPLLQKYSSTMVLVHCYFCRVKTHRTKDCCALSTLTEIFDKNMFKVDLAGVKKR